MLPADSRTFRRDLRGQDNSFAAAYANEYNRRLGDDQKTLDRVLTELTEECQALRKRLKGNQTPERQKLEGRRCAVHDIYFSRKFMQYPAKEILREFRRLKSRAGSRFTIVVWVMGQKKIKLPDTPPSDNTVVSYPEYVKQNGPRKARKEGNHSRHHAARMR